jgi:hypothetical protein
MNDMVLPIGWVLGGAGTALAFLVGIGRVLWAKIEANEKASAERHKQCEERSEALGREIREMRALELDRALKMASRAMDREEVLARLVGSQPQMATDETVTIHHHSTPRPGTNRPSNPGFAS